MIRTSGCCFLVLASLAAGTPARALTTTLPVAAVSPVIDGRLAPEEKAGAAQVSLKVIGGIDLPRNPTTAYLKLTADALYIGYTCADQDPKSVIAAAGEGGAVFLDDSVQLFLAPETEASRTNYFHFAVNAAGAKYSSSLSTDEPVEGWQAAAVRTESGWECEMLIPLKAVEAPLTLRYWRANIARERPARGTDPQETTAWVNPGASLHNYRRFGFLQLGGAAQAVAALTRPAQDAAPVTSAPLPLAVPAAETSATQTASAPSGAR